MDKNLFLVPLLLDSYISLLVKSSIGYFLKLSTLEGGSYCMSLSVRLLSSLDLPFLSVFLSSFLSVFVVQVGQLIKSSTFSQIT